MVDDAVTRPDDKRPDSVCVGGLLEEKRSASRADDAASSLRAERGIRSGVMLTTLLPGPADLQLHVVGIAKHDDGDPEPLAEIADLAVRDPVTVEDADRVVQRRP